jgi:hypothetical protein
MMGTPMMGETVVDQGVVTGEVQSTVEGDAVVAPSDDSTPPIPTPVPDSESTPTPDGDGAAPVIDNSDDT